MRPRIDTCEKGENHVTSQSGFPPLPFQSPFPPPRIYIYPVAKLTERISTIVVYPWWKRALVRTTSYLLLTPRSSRSNSSIRIRKNVLLIISISIILIPWYLRVQVPWNFIRDFIITNKIANYFHSWYPLPRHTRFKCSKRERIIKYIRSAASFYLIVLTCPLAYS